MSKFTGYETDELIHQGKKSLVYRAVRESDGKKVILKTLRPGESSRRALKRLRREYELLTSAPGPALVRAWELLSGPEGLFLVLEDFDAVSLKEFLRDNPLDEKAFCAYAAAIVDAIAHMHRRGLIHKDIKPANILINPRTHEIKLCDLGNSTRVESEFSTPEIQHGKTEVMEGTLAYISPEQTGRMNRAVDYRTDLYSLGVTCYEMLTGSLPFTAKTAQELVYAHIARKAPPVESLRPNTPAALRHIIERLLSKNAEDRYQSCAGVAADLRVCASQLEEYGHIGALQTGQRDVSDKFQIAQKLYGREHEIAVLLQAFERARNGPAEFLMVSGYSGIGKTTLVNETHRPIAGSRGYFISGKYDQVKRSIPYSALGDALRDLVLQVLTREDEEILEWSRALKEGLGVNAHMVADLVPEITLLIGETKTPATADPGDSRNRFHLAFRGLFQAAARQDSPLALFLDDLQWADTATLDLLKHLLVDANLEHLLLIGAYRDNEVDDSHPLILTLKEIYQSDAQAREIKLTPLSREHLIQLTAETLLTEAEQVRRLATDIHARTEGNPLFVNQSLLALYRKGFFQFDYDAGRWTWRDEQFEEAGVTDSLIDLLTERISQLPDATREVLKLAACIGNRFALDTLAIVAKQNPDEIEEHIEKVRALGFVLPLRESGRAELKSPVFRFLHDRVQQAAYSLIEEERRREVHLQVGRLLLGALEGEARENALFEILGHMNEGLELMESDQERSSIATLNMEAARKARDATAYHLAIRYFRAALQLLSHEAAWQSQPQTAYEVYRDLAECEYLVGNFQESEKLFLDILARIDDLEKIAEIEHLRVVQYNNTMRQAEGIDIVRAVLRKLGTDIPPDDEIENPFADIERINVAVDEIAAIEHAPEIAEPAVYHSIVLLMDIYITAYVTGRQSLAILILIKSMILCLRHGNSVTTSYVYGLYGALAGSALGDFRAGYEYGKLSVALSRKYGDSSLIAKNFLSYPALTQCWQEPLRETVPYLREGYQHALDSGTLVYAGYLLLFLAKHPILVGTSLVEVSDAGLGYIKFFRRLGDKFQLLTIQTIVYSALALEGGTRRDFLLEYEEYTEDSLKILESPEGVLFHCWCLVARIQLYFLRGDYEKAFDLALDGRKLDIKTIMFGHAQVAEFFLYGSLAAARVFAHASGERKEQCLELMKENREAVQYWLDRCLPETFEFRILLMDAELARIQEGAGDASALYEAAMDAAEQAGFVQHAALAAQMLGELHAANGRTRLSSYYLYTSLYFYERWGAYAVIRRIKTEYSGILREDARVMAGASSFSSTATISSTSSKLDLSTVLDTYQVLSRELQMDQLIEKLMRIVVEIAGAEYGLLFLMREEMLVLKASAAHDQIRIHEGEDTGTGYSTAVVNYTANSDQIASLEDASREPRFSADPYIQAKAPKSILCVPLLHQGMKIGILYLENNLAYGAFRNERIELVRMLSAQIAISLQNAGLYHGMEEKVKERTRELEETVVELRTTQKELFASRLSAMLGRMVAGVAHEINTPIGIGVTAASTLSDQMKIALEQMEGDAMRPEETREFMRTAQEAGHLILSNLNRAAELVQAFKQVAVDQTSEGRRKFKLKEYLSELLLSLKPRLRTTNLNLEIFAPEDVTLDSYPGALSQIITNLIFNSIEHAFPNNTAGNLVLRVSRRGEQVRLDYSDDGTGIAPEHLPRIFDLFYTTRGQTGGTGLGLHIVYNLITQKLGGRIDTRSEIGKGTHFIIDLPETL